MEQTRPALYLNLQTRFSTPHNTRTLLPTRGADPLHRFLDTFAYYIVTMIANINGNLRKRIDRDSSLTDVEVGIVGHDAWNSFCDDVDKAFRVECIATTLYASTPIVFLALFIAGCTLCGIANNQYDMTLAERNKKRTIGGALIGAAFGYLIIVCTLGAIVSFNAENKVPRVCIKHTTDRVTFKYCDTGGPDYFKIEVKNSNANWEPEVTFAPAIHVADTQPASAAERLRELEDMKVLLDAETYEAKKAEIMSSV